MKRDIGKFAVVIAVTLVSGCAAAPEIIPPPCSQPAWLDGSFDPRASGYIVTFVDEVTDVASSAQELAQKYSFTIDNVYQSAIKGFGVKTLTPSALAELRCDRRILGVSFNESIRMSSNART
jgi:hypothetical protein